MNITVVVPTYQRPALARRTVRLLREQSRIADEIIVVDQTPEPDVELEREAAASGGRLRYVREARPSLPNARNVGIRLSRGDMIAFIDDDELPDRGWLGHLEENYADASIAGVGGRIIGGYDAAGEPIGTYQPDRGIVTRYFSSTRRAEVAHVPGGNMSFRRPVFDAVGGFDAAYGGNAIGEETDFCLRAGRRGFRFVYDPSALVVHEGGHPGGCRMDAYALWLRWHAHNAVLFALRHYRGRVLPGFLLRRLGGIVRNAVEQASPRLVADGLAGLIGGCSTHLRTRP